MGEWEVALPMAGDGMRWAQIILGFCFNLTAKAREKHLHRWGSPGSRNIHPRTGGSEMGCNPGLRHTGVKTFPCHLLPQTCYFLLTCTPCPQLSGPPTLFFSCFPYPGEWDEHHAKSREQNGKREENRSFLRAKTKPKHRAQLTERR